jgi:hypothetical protein
LRRSQGGGALDTVRSLSARLAPVHLQGILREWIEPDRHPGLRGTSNLWLEFDLPRDGLSERAIPEMLLRPSVCVQMAHGEEDRGGDPCWVLESLLPKIHGGALSPAQRRAGARVLAAVPPEARLLYVFSLLPRGEGAVRLEFFGVPDRKVVEVVEKAGAGMTAERVAEAAALLGEVERPHLSFDLLPDGISPRVGLEGSFRGLPRREPRWGALFDRLEGAGLCCPAKRQAVFAWPGYSTARTASAVWPSVEGRPVPGFHVRSLSHVKLVCRSDRPLEAKVYLLTEYLPRRPAGG